MITPVNHNERIVLGLDLGTNSIGWSLVALENDKPSRLIDIGVRIFNKGVGDKTPTPKNQKRREARLARRVIQRRSRRKKRMESYLTKLGLLPAQLANFQEREQVLNSIGDPYELRARALDEIVKPHELGRIFLHMVQRRGFLSNRKTALGDLVDDPDVMAVLDMEDAEEEAGKPSASSKTEEGQFKQQIANLRDAIRASGLRTLGEYLHRSEGLESKRNRIRNGGDLRTDRAMYRQELDLIWHRQKEHHEVLTENVREQIDEIIFFQRPIKLRADRVGKCSLERNNKRCAAARLEYQEFRYLQDINNLRYIEPYSKKEVALSSEDREKVAVILEQQKSLSFNKLRTIVGLDKSYVFNLEAATGKKLKGNLTSISIQNVLPQWKEYNQDKKAALLEDLLTIKKKSALRRRLEGYWQFSTNDAIALCLLEFEEGHANLSFKAINKLLPFLRQGLTYDKARVKAGYDYINDIDVVDKLPKPPVITNPIVSRGLNEVRKLVNAIIKAYGKPAIVRIEMARDLEMNTKRYKQFISRQKKNEKANENAETKWSEVAESNPGLKLRKYPSRDDKIKFRLWEDQSMVCAYSGRAISMTQLFSDDTEVDHIIPYSFSLDDSYMNKVVCFTAENRQKGNKTPIDAFGEDEERWNQITGAMSKWDKALFSKKNRFFMREGDIEKGFSASQLVDTRYIAKETLAYLGQLCADVSTTKGIMTSWLRRQWGLNSLISETDVKDRNDHRHHAIDAVITACIDRNFYQGLLRMAKDIETSPAGLSMNDLALDEPWETFRDDLKQKVDDLLISHQTTSKISGALHEETGVGYVDGIGTVYRKSINEPFNIKNVVDDNVRKILEKHLAKHGGNHKIAFSTENPVYHKDGKTKIKRIRVKQTGMTLKELDTKKIAVRDPSGKSFKWHAYGNVHSARFYHDAKQDNFKAVLLTVAESKRQNVIGIDEPVASDQQYLFTLHKNDAVSLTLDGEEAIYRVQKLGFTNNRLDLLKNNLAASKTSGDTVIVLLNSASIRRYKLKKVQIDVLGNVRK